MKCPRCQADNPAGASFCMRCANPLGAPPAVTSMPVLPKSNSPWKWITGLAVLALICAGLGMSGLLRFNAQPANRDMLRSEARHKPELLAVEKKPDNNLTQVPVEAQAQMPAEIREWLEHLRKTEEARQRLCMGQIGEFTVTMTKLQVAGAADMLKDMMGGDETALQEEPQQPSSTTEVHQAFESAQKDWRELRAHFESKIPPRECEAAADSYNVALSETSGMMLDLMSALDRAVSGTDEDKQAVVGELSKMKGSSKTIDEAGGKTDAEVQAICDHYKVRKWFGIASDIGGGGLFNGTGIGF